MPNDDALSWITQNNIQLKTVIASKVECVSLLLSELYSGFTSSSVNFNTYLNLRSIDQDAIKKQVEVIFKQMKNLQSRSSNLEVLLDKITQLKVTVMALIELDPETITLGKKINLKFNTPDSVSTSRTSYFFQKVGLTQTATATVVQTSADLIRSLRQKYSLCHDIIIKDPDCPHKRSRFVPKFAK